MTSYKGVVPNVQYIRVNFADLYDQGVSIHDVTECDVNSRWHRAGFHSQLCDRLACRHGDSEREGLAHTRPQTEGDLLGLDEQRLDSRWLSAAEVQ